MYKCIMVFLAISFLGLAPLPKIIPHNKIVHDTKKSSVSSKDGKCIKWIKQIATIVYAVDGKWYQHDAGILCVLYQNQITK